MDELDLAQARQKEFQKELLLRQEEERDAAIESDRESLEQEGLEAQKRFEEEGAAESGRRDFASADIEGTMQMDAEQREIEMQQQEDLEQEIDQSVNDISKARSIESAKEIIHGGGHDMTDSEVSEVIDNPPEKVPFPQGMFALAVLKDILDIILTATVVGIIIVFIYSVFYFIISIDWTLKRANKLGFAKKFI